MDKALRVKLATPCKADWSQMKGDDRARFCAMCRKNVFNISALTAQQARELVRQKEGNLCVAFYQRPDGTVLTADCPVAVNAARRSVAFALTLVAAIFLVPGLLTLPAGGNLRIDWARIAHQSRGLPVLGPLINRIAPPPPPPPAIARGGMTKGGFKNWDGNDY